LILEKEVDNNKQRKRRKQEEKKENEKRISAEEIARKEKKDNYSACLNLDCPSSPPCRPSSKQQRPDPRHKLTRLSSICSPTKTNPPPWNNHLHNLKTVFQTLSGLKKKQTNKQTKRQQTKRERERERERELSIKHITAPTRLRRI